MIMIMFVNCSSLYSLQEDDFYVYQALLKNVMLLPGNFQLQYFLLITLSLPVL